jgi:hypothetical protein
MKRFFNFSFFGRALLLLLLFGVLLDKDRRLRLNAVCVFLSPPHSICSNSRVGKSGFRCLLPRWEFTLAGTQNTGLLMNRFCVV